MKNFNEFYRWYLRYFQSKDEATATIYDKFMALSYAVRTHVIDNWIETQRIYKEHSVRRTYYLSLDHSFGRSLKRHIIEVGMESDVDNITDLLKADFNDICECEPDFEMGNCPKGGIARSFQETMVSQGIPAMGYGVWYDFAQFKQKIVDGMQIELPYNWKNELHPWNINRPEYSYTVEFGGTIKYDESGEAHWHPADRVVASPWDYPVVGYKNGAVNTVRFWEAISTGDFKSDYLNHADYGRACSDKSTSTDVSRFLFPDGDVKQTTELRIRQQYFMATASLYDIVRRHKLENDDISSLTDKVVIHLADSKCAIAIIELLRILIYDEGVKFKAAMEMICKIFIFSSAALDYDDLERWPLYLLEEILPLHTKLLFDMNHYFLHLYRENYGISDDEARDLSIIEEGAVKKIRLANVAVLVSRTVTGLSNYQTSILKDKMFPTIAKISKSRFLSGTYGISIRRSLAVCNPALANMISTSIGDGWIAHNHDLIKFVNYSTDRSIQKKFLDIKAYAKLELNEYLQNRLDIEFNYENMVVMQCRQIHPALRQSMQLFYVIHRYLQLKSGKDLIGRTYFVGGRAAPSNFLGKQLVHLINIVSSLINKDSETNDKLQLFYIPNCGITLEERLLPAIDITEHLAGKGATSFGVDILKYVVNGALPVFGSSKADLEIAEMLGTQTCFSFEDEKIDIATYDPNSVVMASDDLTKIFEFIESHIPEFPKGEGVYPLLSTLRYNDEFNTIGSFEKYCSVQDKVDEQYKDNMGWAEWSLHNIARAGHGSLDEVVNNLYT